MSGKNAALNKRNIYLVGFMGAGKTTIGRLLAERLGWPFYDTDEAIEKKSGKAISEIFEKHGERHFRAIESEVVEAIARRRSAVIALGGGAIMAKQNWQDVHKTGTVIYLNWNPDALFSRIESDPTRPLVFQEKVSHRREALEQLYEKRKASYERADIIINCGKGIQPTKIVEKILGLLPRQIR